MSESEVLALIRLELGKIPGVLLFRNNSGALRDKMGRMVRFGVGGPGGSDLIGFVVRNGVAVFLAIEVKAPGARTEPRHYAAQENFIRIVRDHGGLAGFASSVEEAMAIIK